MYKFISFFAGKRYYAFDLNSYLKEIPPINGNGVFFIENGDDTASLITVTKIDISENGKDAAKPHENPLTGETDLLSGEAGFVFTNNILKPSSENKPYLEITADGANIYLRFTLPLDGIKRDHAIFSQAEANGTRQ